MRALVVYESMFGNSAKVAGLVAAGLEKGYTVTLADVREMPPLTGVDLLVLGGPTHAFGMSRPATRADAARQGAIREGAQEAGIREFLDRAPQLAGVAVAAFDTRSNTPLPSGSAARKAMRRLRGLGGRQVLEAESFRVESARGPLVAGEEERARQWGETLALSVRGPVGI
ncbi:flavodoxin family protein [Actinoplanes teichomyceticus]|uniref:Flavodoxin n=1 Tax=Actinoplanes teichomyceticus TaxID=1867 RepID=A0A561VLR0_ACTTI|nr:flavodoxin family protein [Actinoplanes teichomyceticus]TWG12539.1 flavodoxin [Actinoplanes teichomyceticus]GIF13905.1 flavodoxin [Actinoplanes teichomyceticus]